MKKQIDPESVVREIKRKTRRKFSSEEEIGKMRGGVGLLKFSPRTLG